MKIFHFCLFVTLLVVSCSQAPSDSAIQTAIAQTQSLQSTTGVVQEIIPSTTYTPKPTQTRAPTETPKPTNTPKTRITLTPTNDVDLSRVKAKNYITSQESGGIVIDVARILIADKTAFPEDFFDNPSIFVSNLINR